MSDSVARKTAVGATWLIAWRFLTRLLGVLTTLIMARILVPADFGLLAMASAFTMAIDALSQLGLHQALIRRPEEDNRLHDTAFTFQAGRALLTGLLIALSAPAAARWFGEPRLELVIWIFAGVSVLSGFRNIGVVAFGRDMDYRRQFILLCVPRLIQVALTIPVALLLQSYWALVIGIVVSKVCDLIMTYVFHPYRPKLSFAGWRELAGFSLWTWAASVASIVWDRCDPFVLGPVIGTAQLGVFLVATEIATLPVTEVVAPASDALFAGFSRAQKHGASPIAKALPVATTLLFMIMPIMVGVSCSSGYLVAATLGPRWATAQPLVAIAAWLGCFSPYSYICSAALVSANHVRSNFAANGIVSIVRLAALVIVSSLTSDLTVITTVVVLVVGAEASVFAGLVILAGGARPADSAGGMLRTLISGAGALALTSITGLAWQPVDLPVVSALLTGIPLGCFAILSYAAIAACLWKISGQPDGPERQVMHLIRQVAGPAMTKLCAPFARSLGKV